MAGDIARTVTVTGFGNMSQLESALEKAGFVAESTSKTITGAAADAGKAAAAQAEQMGLSADKQVSAAARAAAASVEASAKITTAQRAAAAAATKAAEAAGLSADEQVAASSRAMSAQAKFEADSVASSSRVGAAFTKLGSTMGAFGLPFSGSLKKMGSDITEAEGKTASFGASMAAVGKVGAFTGIAAFGAAAYEGVKGAVALEKSMEQIHTQAGASTAEVKRMTGAVEGMAGSVATGPQQLAESLYHVESTGLRGAKALDVLKYAAEGAKIGGANIVDVQNALDAAVVSGISGVQNYGQAMGALNSIVGAGDMKMQDLADALGTGLLANMKTYGLSLRDTGAALAVFGDNNIRGQDAATKLTSAVRIMAAPSAAASKALGVVGLSSLQLASDMRSGGLVKALQDLKSHLTDSGATAEQQGLIIARAFGGRQSTGVQLLLEQLGRLKEKQQDVGAGAKGFGRDWEDTTHTLGFAFDQAKAALQGLDDKLGFMLIPELKMLGGALADGVQWLERHKTAAQGLGVVIAGTLGLAVAVFAERTAVKFGTAVMNMVGDMGKLVSKVTGSTGAIAADFEAQGAAADAAAEKIGVATGASSSAVQVEADKMQTSFAEIDSGFAGTAGAAGESAGGIATAETATVTAVSGADTAIEAENAAAGASFSAMLGPIGLVAAAVYELNKHLSAGDQIQNLLGGNQPGESGKEGELFAKEHGNFGSSSTLGPGISNSTATKYGALAEAASAKYGIPVNVLLADIEQESSGNPLAKSSAGAQGLTQFMPETAAKYGVKFGSSQKDIASQIMGQAHYLHDLGGEKDIKRALEGYLGEHGPQGEAYAKSVLAKAGYKGSDKTVHEVDALSKSFKSKKAEQEAHNLTKDAAGLTHAQLVALGAAKETAAEKAKKRAASALGVPVGVTTMLATAQALIGTKYTSGGGHDGWDPIAALKKIGVDCSGFVSQTLHAGGVLANPVTTEGLTSAKGIARGAGKYVTLYDRPNDGTNSHVIEEILGKYFESGGNPKYNPKGGVTLLTAAQAKGELSSGGFEAFHPTALNRSVPGGASASTLVKGLASQEAVEAAFAAAVSKLTGSGTSQYKKYETDLQSGNIKSLEKLLGSTTANRSGSKSVAHAEFDQLVAGLRAVHIQALTQLASKLVTVHHEAQVTLTQELAAQQETTDARLLNLQAGQLKDQTQIQQGMAEKVVEAMKDAATLMVDGINSAATGLKDAGQSIADQFAAQAQAIKDATQAMSDTSAAAVTQIQDKSQTEVDTLGERGLYGLNLVAQKQQVQLDQMKTGYDAQIAQAQQAMDTAQTSTDNAAAATKALVDAVTAQQDVLIGQAQTGLDSTQQQTNAAVQNAQQNLNNVTAATDAAVQNAQAAVDKASTGTQAQQNTAAAALAQAQGNQAAQVAQAEAALTAAKNAASSAVQQAQDALNGAQAHATLAEQEASNALVSAEGNASVVLAQAAQVLAGLKGSSEVAEAQQKALIEKIKAESATQYAGSGLTVNIEGINPTDAAAIASEVGWVMRTQIPA